MRPGEGRAAFLFFLHGFLLLLLPGGEGAARGLHPLEVLGRDARYAVALMALVLMLVVPFTALRRHLDGAQLLRAVTLFFVPRCRCSRFSPLPGTHRLRLLHLGRHLRRHGRLADLGVRSRLLQRQERPATVHVIMLGANLGALAGAKFTQLLVAALSPMD